MNEKEKLKDFEAVTLKYLDGLNGFALFLTQERDIAEDLVQDTYLRAYQFFHRYEHGTNCKAWLYTIMKNIFINRFHRRSWETRFTRYEERNGEPYESPRELLFSIDVTLEKGIFRQDIERAMSRLPDKLREVILLKDVEGFDYKEIARIVNCPIGTVMSRLFRGRNLMKKALKDYYITDGVRKKERQPDV